MKLLCLITIAFGSTATAAVPWPVSGRDSSATQTTAAQDVPAIGTIPASGGPDVLLPTASLVLGAGILAYAALRRWRRI